MQNHLKKVIELRKDGKIEQSIQLLLSLIKEDPENSVYHYELARGLDRVGSESEAIPYYERAIELGLPDEELEEAFVGLGTTYLYEGCYLKSQDLFERAMDQFPEKEQMKLFYGMALLNLNEHKEAMRFIIPTLVSTTSNKDILKHQSALIFLGGNLGLTRDRMKQFSSHLTEDGASSDKSIVEKVRLGLDNVGLGYFDTAESSEYDEYYRYFNDPDFETRKCALAEFTVMLGNWHACSATAFTPQQNRKFGHLNGPNYQWNELNPYIEAFVSHQKIIEQDFPVMNDTIIWFLIHIEIENKLRYERVFPEVDEVLFKRLREEILLPFQEQGKGLPEGKYFLKEAGIPPFFEGDFI